MNKIQAYIPQAKTKQGKASIRGLWVGKQGVCYDYLHKASIPFEQLAFVKKHYKQEAIFYRVKRKAYIWYNENRQDVLIYQDYFSFTGRQGLKAYIKDLLKVYGGLTVYIKSNKQYLFEVWHS